MIVHIKNRMHKESTEDNNEKTILKTTFIAFQV